MSGGPELQPQLIRQDELLRRANDSLRRAKRQLSGYLQRRSGTANETNPFVLLKENLRVPHLLESAIAATGADYGNVQLFDSGLGILRIVAHSGFPSVFLDYFESVKQDDGCACALAMKSGSRLLVADVASNPSFRDTARRVLLLSNVGSVQSTPLLDHSGTLIGVVSTHYKHVQNAFWKQSPRWNRLDNLCFDFVANTRSTLNVNANRVL